jgi:hemerythrin-like domain-containing protein
MKRDQRLVRLTREHHKALVMAMRINRELPGADDTGVESLYTDLLEFWKVALLPHFRAENECLLTRLSRHVTLSDELLGRTCRDHIQLDGLIMTMRDKPGQRRDALARFGILLHEHVRWEEDILFERSQEILADEEMTALGIDLEDRLPEELPFPADRLYPKSD